MRELLIVQSIFLLILLPLLYGVQRFWFVQAWQATRQLKHDKIRKALQSTCLIAVALLLLVVIDFSAVHIIPRNRTGTLILSASMIWFGASALWMAAILAYRFALGFRRRSAVSPLQDEVDSRERRLLLRRLGQIGAGLPFFAATYATGRQRLSFRTDSVAIPVTGLPKELSGFRVVHLSDIHMGDFMPASELRRIVDIANGLRADLAVVTGDFISDRNDPLRECIEELGRLRVPLGVWGCNGNHEIYADAEDTSHKLFQQHGMCLLRQENTVLRWRDAAFNLIGVDYQIQGRDDVNQMLSGVETLVRRDMPNILLSHNPNSFYRAADLGIELVLAGHTHGGQVDVEILHRDINPAVFFTRFVAGPYKLPLSTLDQIDQGEVGRPGRFASLYVNRGIGTVKIPIRWGVPPEIALLTLVPAA